MTDDAPYKTITVTPKTAAVGATIGEIDLTQRIPNEAVREIHTALMRHGVVFFRDQHLTPKQHADFARPFGRMRIAKHTSFEIFEGVPEMSVLINDKDRPPNVNHYHSDGIFRQSPEFASILRAVECPVAGGDTIFIGSTAAYNGLSESMKAYLSNKNAIHNFMKLHGSPKKNRSWEGDGAARMERAQKANPPVIHPLVRIHPVSGRKSLYISESFTMDIEGLPQEESRGLLTFLFRHCALPEYQCRFHWRPGSIAFWDNRATQHYAVADYWPERRLMHRVSIETDELGSGEAWPNAA
jgi:taurine dioxygenase